MPLFVPLSLNSTFSSKSLTVPPLHIRKLLTLTTFSGVVSPTISPFRPARSWDLHPNLSESFRQRSAQSPNCHPVRRSDKCHLTPRVVPSSPELLAPATLGSGKKVRSQEKRLAFSSRELYLYRSSFLTPLYVTTRASSNSPLPFQKAHAFKRKQVRLVCCSGTHECRCAHAQIAPT